VPFAKVRPFIFNGVVRVALTELRAGVSRSRKRGKPSRSGTRGRRVKAINKVAGYRTCQNYHPVYSDLFSKKAGGKNVLCIHLEGQ